MVLVTIATLSMAGCKTWGLEGDPLEAVSGDEIRARDTLDPTTKGVGVSSKARQIERSFGIE